MRVTGSLHMTIQTAVLIETLVDLGAIRALGKLQHLLHAGSRRRRHRRRRRAGLRLEGRDRSKSTGGARTRRSAIRAARVRSWSWTTAATPRCSSTKATSSKNGSDWVNTPSGSHEEKVIKDLLKKVHAEDPQHWHEVVKDWRGVSEETTTGVHRLYKMQEAGQAAGPRHQRQRLGHQDPSSTTCTAAANRWPTASSAPPT